MPVLVRMLSFCSDLWQKSNKTLKAQVGVVLANSCLNQDLLQSRINREEISKRTVCDHMIQFNCMATEPSTQPAIASTPPSLTVPTLHCTHCPEQSQRWPSTTTPRAPRCTAQHLETKPLASGHLLTSKDSTDFKGIAYALHFHKQVRKQVPSG